MDAYAYQAALLCDYCAKEVRDDLDARSIVDDEDSDTYPQGPYSGGGGEADCPQHCDHCNAFLQNSLTTDGVAYVQERVDDSPPDSIARTVWAPFYGIRPTSEEA